MEKVKALTTEDIEVYIPTINPVLLPLMQNAVSAGATGFPSPAEDYLQDSLDLNEYLGVTQNTTFFVKVVNDSMKGLDIRDGDILVIDTNAPRRNKSIVVCCLNGELIVKRLEKKENKIFLVSANDKYPPIQISSFDDLVVFGVSKAQCRIL